MNTPLKTDKPKPGLFMRRSRLIMALAAVVVAFLFGLLINSGDTSGAGSEILSDNRTREATLTSTSWTCSMHPQIQLPAPGKCPICFMDLIPVTDGTESVDALDINQIRMTAAAMKLADIQTSPVIRAHAHTNLRLPGKVSYDETRVTRIAAWVSGRIHRVYADYTGITIKESEPLIEIYSPELYSAQRELISAHRLAEDLARSNSNVLSTTAETTLRAARRKLELLGLTPEQIKEIEEYGNPSEYITIYSPAAGIVVEKQALEGQYVDAGTPLYTIADLRRVWIVLDAYETDLPWLAEGQEVSFTSPSLPGVTLRGIISFIEPVLDDITRTASVRVQVDNADLTLKPDMFVTGNVTVSPVINAGDFGGKLSTSDKSTGGSTGKMTGDMPLLIPSTAPLLTGKRAVVYVKLPEFEEPTFEGREVVLGPRSGDYYIVKDGLSDGELVVTNGAFKIDSELQIRAGRSMMSPAGGGPAPAHHHPTDVVESNSNPRGSHQALTALTPVYESYFNVQTALAADDLKAAGIAYGGVIAEISRVDSSGFDKESKGHWAHLSENALNAARSGSSSVTIADSRDAFYHLSNALISLEEQFGHGNGARYYLAFCPMARDNQGAFWMQKDSIVNNSYWGAAMLRCGEIKQQLPPAL